jgi:hypothetical protein
LKNLPDVNMHFHHAATRYQGGDILIMFEQSQPLVDAFGVTGVALDNAIASAAHLRTINPRTRAVFYGTEHGITDIDLDNPKLDVFLAAKSAPDIPATMRAIAEQYPCANPCNPLHVIMISGGGVGKNYSEAAESMLALMNREGTQVMMDFILIPSTGQTLFQRMAGVAASKMLNGGKEIGNAINKRISPDNPRQFMLDLVCSIVGRGTCTPVSCPTTARFNKQRKP